MKLFAPEIDSMLENYQIFQDIMALAFIDHHIPFVLSDVEEILGMLSGTDNIGIVPDYVFPRYCHGLFPKVDRIVDFMNLDREVDDRIIPLAYWYPLERTETTQI